MTLGAQVCTRWSHGPFRADLGNRGERLGVVKYQGRKYELM